MKAYDEESVASLSTTQDETQDSFQMNNGTAESAYILSLGQQHHRGPEMAASLSSHTRIAPARGPGPDW